MKSINKIRQMKWFGTPAKTDLKYLNKETKKPRCRQRISW